jgi:hypothetical protein
MDRVSVISRNKTLSAVPCMQSENALAQEVKAMNDLSPRSVVLQFIEFVNQGDLDGIASFVSDGVVFTDILGRVYQEKNFMENYLSMSPPKLKTRSGWYGPRRSKAG